MQECNGQCLKYEHEFCLKNLVCFKDSDAYGWFVCYFCNCLRNSWPTYVQRTKGGDVRPCCSECNSFCDTCVKYYANDHPHDNEDCEKYQSMSDYEDERRGSERELDESDDSSEELSPEEMKKAEHLTNKLMQTKEEEEINF